MNCLNRLKVAVVVCALALTALPLLAIDSMPTPSRSRIKIDSLRETLTLVNSPSDSIPLLYNLFDLAPYDERLPYALQLLQTARNAGNELVQLDMYNHLSNLYAQSRNPEGLEQNISELNELEPSDERNVAICFAASLIPAARTFANEEERAEELRRFVAEVSAQDAYGERVDIYERIASLFSLATCMQGVSDGELLTETLDHLDIAIATLPPDKATPLRNKFYLMSAISYGRNEDYDKAVAADRKLLSVMDRLQQSYARQGRIFRDFQLNRYISYRRMLRNYEGLSAGEAEAIYDNILEMARENEDIARDLQDNPIARAGLLMKQRNYAEAVPLLQRLAQKAKNIYDKRYFLQRLKQAALSSGNDEVLTKAALEYNDILEEFAALKSAERMRELKMLYEYQSQKDTQHRSYDASLKKYTVFGMAAVALLLVILIVFAYLLITLRRDKLALTNTNKQLQKESEQLAADNEQLSLKSENAHRSEEDKTRLVTYLTNEVLTPVNAIVEYSQMVVDNVHGDNREYLERFLNTINTNAEILQGLVADVQDLATIENGKLPATIIPTDLDHLGRVMTDTIRPQLKHGVEISFVPSGRERFVTDTDPRRVQIILLNLLSNAAKFTTHGSIELKCGIDAKKRIFFSVTDTGIGIDPLKADIIFNRFEKLDPSTPGPGLGLSICAMVARSIGGVVRLDTDYPGPGSRFLLLLKDS